MATKANLALYQGDDYSAVVTVTNGASGVPDLTGYTAQAQIRTAYADQQPAIACEMATEITANTITLAIPHADTVTLAGSYLWDLQIVDTAGVITTLLAGAVTVTPEVTREPGNAT